MGFVFQSYNLIPTLTVLENVSLVKEIAPEAMSPEEMLDAVGLADHMKNFPRSSPAANSRGIHRKGAGEEPEDTAL